MRADLNIPRSSLHGILSVMVDGGFVDRTLPDGFSIGIRSFEVGTAWTVNLELNQVSRPILAQMARDLNQIVHVGVLDGTDVIYVMKQESARPIRLVSAVGKKLPAHATALGKLLLGSSSDDQVEQLYAGFAFEKLTTSTIVSVGQLIEQVRRFREWGYAIDEQESTEGVVCFAAPIYDSVGHTIAALSTSVLEDAETPAAYPRYIEAVKVGAQQISRALGAPSNTFTRNNHEGRE
jgi:IclR family KDG regulon transcriptional repressor